VRSYQAPEVWASEMERFDCDYRFLIFRNALVNFMVVIYMRHIMGREDIHYCPLNEFYYFCFIAPSYNNHNNSNNSNTNDYNQRNNLFLTNREVIDPTNLPKCHP
jgi:hypothetical protein